MTTRNYLTNQSSENTFRKKQTQFNKMIKMIIYIAGAVVIVMALLVAAFEIFSSYPTHAIVYNTTAPVQSVKTIAIHGSPGNQMGCLYVLILK